MPLRSEQPSLRISPRTVATAMGVAIAFFLAMHLLVTAVDRGIGRDAFPGSEVLVRFLSMDNELNAPTWYSASVLLACATLAATIGLAQRLNGIGDRHWLLLAVVLAFLSLDEAALLHEDLSDPLTGALDLKQESWEFWAWVLPYVGGAALFAAASVGFLRRIPPATARLMVVAGVIYVAGAAGMELVGRSFFEDADNLNTAYLLTVGVEETLEMVGAAVLAYALLTYLRDVVGPVRLSVADASPERERTGERTEIRSPAR